MVADIFRSIIKPKIKPLNCITIKKKNILSNLKYLSSFQKESSLFPVVKSNAYGHGLKEICEILEETDIKKLCVDSYIEYQFVEKYTTKDILVLWETNHENYKHFNFKRTAFCVSNLDTINYLIWLGRSIKIHLFLNTGMNREGFQKKELKSALEILKGSKIEIEWVMSHFSSADDPNMKQIKVQVKVFKDMYKQVEKTGLSVKYRHISNSAGTIKFQDEFFNACRPGIALYGYNPLSKKDKSYKLWEKLKPALDVYTTVVSVQEVKKGEWVSYNLTHEIEKDTRLATIPFGYYEWLDRRLSNKLEVQYKKDTLALRGRVCMNLSTLEIGKKKIHRWDMIKLISSNPKDINSVQSIANTLWTISYEVLTGLKESIHKETV